MWEVCSLFLIFLMAFFVACVKLLQFCFLFYKMGIIVLKAFGKLFEVTKRVVEQLNGMAAGCCYLCV